MQQVRYEAKDVSFKWITTADLLVLAVVLIAFSVLAYFYWKQSDRLGAAPQPREPQHTFSVEAVP